ncbi:aspartate aminotransferase family protein [Paracoccus saliphilus]|uniref:Aspartate aminotransferase family protein n=1 Tax=Paracoccus saliphilus TaxID=405559 RepID=A0AA45W2Q6_9RHOB|nr:aspartate aminotransferase family protein [Paracoccus saliphilus]WCR01402.1 aspartate aminotransferase family protein [Paracoccus saliphilus]SIS69951.1 glutamate-1-semialdehyde 2,1-aminomutase [Paracoccus saliphilus]
MFETSKSATLYDRAKKVMPGGNTRHTVFRQPHQVYALRGHGCRITDIDGDDRIDAVGNFTALIHGYGSERIREAARRQIDAGPCFGMATEGEIRLSEMLCERLPSVELLRYTNSGTEAVMNAIKVARAFTGRSRFAKCEGAYHGTYDPAETSQEARPESWGEIDNPASVPTAKGTPQGVLDDVVVIPFNNTPVAEAILRAKGNSLAAVLVDVMPNRAGLVPAKPEFLQMLRRVTRELGALLILDEVITFRLGYHGAQGRFGVDPDLTTLGKVIGGGFPIGAIGGRREVMSVFDPTIGSPAVPHGGTFSANPMSMMAGIAALEDLTPVSFEHLESLGELFDAGIGDCFRRHGIEGQVTGLGSLRRMHLSNAELTDFRSTFAAGDGPKRVAALARSLFDEGVIIAANGLMAFSTAMTPDDIQEIIDAFDRALPKAFSKE